MVSKPIAETVVTTYQLSDDCLSASTSSVTRSSSISGCQLTRLPAHCTKDQCFDHRVHRSLGANSGRHDLYGSLVWYERPTHCRYSVETCSEASAHFPGGPQVGTRGEKSLRMIIWDSLVKSATTINWSLNPNNRLFK